MFSGSQQAGVSDLLLGAGGFTGSLGNGFGNDAGPSGAGGSSTGSTPLDLNDFPSLAGNNNNASSSNNSGNGLAAALRQQQQQQQLLAHQQQMLQGGSAKQNNLYRLAMSGSSNGAPNFNMATEDFPALSGAPTSASTGGSSAASSSPSLLLGGANASNSVQQGGGLAFANNNTSRQQSTGLGSLYGNDIDSGASATAPGASLSQPEGAGLVTGDGLGGLALSSVSQQSGNSQQPPSRMGPSSAPSASISGNAAATGTALSGDFGLLGLLGVIRMTDADRNALALGSDLTMLGLNLGSSEQIYSTFSSPFSESTSATKEPQYQLPTCYYMQPPALKTGHLSKFQLETLFYIFYALPKDVLQAYSAQELYTREWRYHGDLKLWFKRAGPSDGVTSSSTTPQYLFFDINTWERRLFNGTMNQNVTNGFLSEDDVRVKFQGS
eukprot:Nitzschia sp. Nitz4//scaffold2_size372955//150720//152131//NITZ4_000407-RA/size372955-snap-gene-0.22-mRNA-1//1//CDS//3329546730//2013//frame0